MPEHSQDETFASRAIQSQQRCKFIANWAITCLLLTAAACFMCLVLQWRSVMYIAPKKSLAQLTLAQHWCRFRTVFAMFERKLLMPALVAIMTPLFINSSLPRMQSTRALISEQNCSHFISRRGGKLWMLSCCRYVQARQKAVLLRGFAGSSRKRRLKLFGLYTHYLLMNCT